MPIHHITKDNEMLLYCRNCDQNATSKEEWVDNITYDVSTCGCGNETRTRKHFHRRAYEDGEFFLNIELLLQ